MHQNCVGSTILILFEEESMVTLSAIIWYISKLFETFPVDTLRSFYTFLDKCIKYINYFIKMFSANLSIYKMTFKHFAVVHYVFGLIKSAFGVPPYLIPIKTCNSWFFFYGYRWLKFISRDTLHFMCCWQKRVIYMLLKTQLYNYKRA